MLKLFINHDAIRKEAEAAGQLLRKRHAEERRMRREIHEIHQTIVKKSR